jgi:NADP-dependent 3-hydroxy acid dehydrogenase YdfG
MNKDIVLIAGGNSLLGEKISEQYISKNYMVVIISRNRNSISNDKIYLKHDLSDILTLDHINANIPNFSNRIKIIIHAVGGYKITSNILEANNYYFDKFVLSYYNLILELKNIIKKNNGIIIYLSSQILENINFNNFAYSSTKHQGEIITKIIAKEFHGTLAQAINIRLNQFTYPKDNAKTDSKIAKISNDIRKLTEATYNNGCTVIL